jgi:hypothetical protein
MGAAARQRADALCAAKTCAQVHLEAYKRALEHRATRFRRSVAVAEAEKTA